MEPAASSLVRSAKKHPLSFPISFQEGTKNIGLQFRESSCLIIIILFVVTVNFTHPIELVKTRMQTSGNGLGTVVSTTLKGEGIGSFWKGIVWAWGREGSYASIKLGAYAPVRDALGASGKDGKWSCR